MATVDVYNLKREKVGTVNLSDEVFAAEVKEHLFYEVVKAQLAAGGRAPPPPKSVPPSAASTKEALQAEGHRPRASRLDPRADLRRRRSGPPAASAGLELPSAAQGALGALRAALSKFPKEGRLVIVDRFELAEIKTKRLLQTLGTLQTQRTRSWSTAANEKLRLSIRNCDDHHSFRPKA